MLLVDSGKSLFKEHNNKNQASLIKAQGIAEAYMLMDYDAVAISASDLDNDETFFKESLNSGFPWISANLLNKSNQLLTEPYVLKTVNSLKIAIIGLTDPPRASSNYKTIEYLEPLTTLTKQLASETDIIILLSNLRREVNQKIATQFPEIAIILSSDKSVGKMPPKVLNNTLITQTSSRGMYLGKLDIDWSHGTTWHNNRLLPLSELIKRRAVIETQLTQLVNNTNKTSNKRISRLQLQQQRLIKEIESRKQQVNELGDHLPNKHTLRFIPVQPTHSPESIESIVVNIDKTLKE